MSELLFWGVAALLTAGCALLIGLPLLWRPAGPATGSAAAIYRQQFEDLSTDIDRVPNSEHGALRDEVGRRLLDELDRESLQTQGAAPHRPVSGRRRIGFVTAGFCLFFGGAGLVYLQLGSLGHRDLPYAERPGVAPADLAERLDALQHLSVTTRNDPDDVGAWIELGAAYESLSRAEAAIEAYRSALAVAPDDLDLVGLVAHAIITAREGEIPQEARTLFRQVLDDRPDDPRARYFLALAKAQDGNPRAALDDLLDLLARTPGGADWRGAVVEAVQATAADLGLSAPALMEDVAPEQAAAIAALEPEAQRQAIAAMVGQLAARLEAAPGDPVGWLQLGRSYDVLGDPAAAEAAYRSGLDHAGDDVDLMIPLISGLWLAGEAGPDWPEGLLPALRRLARISPDEPLALWLLGVHAAETGDFASAGTRWTRLLEILPEGSELRESVRERLDAL